MKLSPAQRETLALLRTRTEPQTARMLGAKFHTLWILQRNGCVEVESCAPNVKAVSDIMFWRITDKGRQEACA